LTLLAEFVFVGWIVMFLYITQITTFGDDFSKMLNFRPLRPVYIAIKYGASNADMTWQILLSAFMFVPLGFLLPIISTENFKSFPSVFILSLDLSLLTETSQILTGRHADIDDIIANTMGGLLGFAMYVICLGFYCLFKRAADLPKNYALNLTISIVVILTTLSPFIMINILSNRGEFGYVYYSHLRPDKVEISNSVSSQKISANVYRYAERETLEDLRNRLRDATGFSGEYYFENDIYTLENGENERIFIYDHNTWSVCYNYEADDEVYPSLPPAPSEAIDMAKSYLERFEIDANTVTFQEFEQGYADNNLHLVFSGISNDNDDGLIWGALRVTLGENGKLIAIEDTRLPCELYREVETISPRESVWIALDVGVESWHGTAVVRDVRPSYYFNKNTGFLIPTWQTEATFTAASGDEYEWSPNIDSVN
jgi:glycopeptide antibiotics resistance protein